MASRSALFRVRLRRGGDAREQAVGHAAPRGGDDSQQLLRRAWERLHAHHQDVAQSVGEHVAVAALGGGEQLLGEEGVAGGAREQRIGHLRVGVGSEDAGELRDQLESRERLELDALDALQPIQLRQEGTERVLAVQLV